MMHSFGRRGTTTRTVLLIVSIVGGFLFVLVLACAGLAYLAWTRVVPAFQSVQASAATFVQDIHAGQLKNAYALTSPGFQARQTFAQFQESVNRYPALRQYTSLTNPQIQVSETTAGTQATVSYTAVGPHDSLSLTLVLVPEYNQWRVDKVTGP